MSEAVHTYSGDVVSPNLTLVEPCADEPIAPNLAAQRLLGRVLGFDNLAPTGLSQAEVEDFFERVVFPEVASLRREQSDVSAKKRSAAALEQSIARSWSDIRRYLQRPDDMNGRHNTPEERLVQTNANLALRPLVRSGQFEDLRDKLHGMYSQALLGEAAPSPSLSHGRQASVHRAGQMALQLARPTLVDSHNPVVTRRVGTSPSTREAMGESAVAILYRRTAGSGDPEDITRTYLNAIGKIPLLTAEQEVVLSKRIEAGLYAGHKLERARTDGESLPASLRRDLATIEREGDRAKQDLTEANLRLVVSLAKKTRSKGLDLIDRIQEGNLGLIRAVEKFDYTKGFKFSTYSTWWIRQTISRGQANLGRTIRLPAHTAELVSKISRIQNKLLIDLGREATDEEIAAEATLEPERVRELLEYDRPPVSTDMPVGEEGDGTLGDFIIGDGADPTFEASVADIEKEERRTRIDEVLDGLSDQREADILRLRFGLIDGKQYTLEEISQIYGLTREGIRQIEKRAMTKLRVPSRNAALREVY